MEQHVTTFSRILTFDTESDYFSVLLDFLYFLPLKCAFFLPSFAKITNILDFPYKKGGKKSPKEPLPTLYHAHSVSLRQKRALLHHQYSHQSQDSVEFRQSSVNHGVSLYIVSLRDTYDTAGRNLTLTDSREQTNQTHT